MPPPPVTIIGAGLGGLTLSRCLRQKGISSVIYDRASTAPQHNYGITLRAWAYKPLLKVLGMDERAFRKRVGVDGLKPTGAGRVSKHNADEPAPIRANLSKLKSLLREGQTVHAEHQLLSAKRVENSQTIELSFENGLHLRSRLLVDAEGVHSQVRRSLLPEVELEVQPFVVYSGKRYLDSDTFSSIYADAFGNSNMLVAKPRKAGDQRLEISVNDYQADGRASISYIYSRAAIAEGDPLARPQRSKDDATQIPEAFFDELKQCIDSQKPPQPFPACFDIDAIRSDRLLHWLMRTCLVPKQDLLDLAEYGAVLIGDAAHAVPILGGEGANMAIMDAIRLSKALKAGQSSTNLKDFYENVWELWNAEVEKCKTTLSYTHATSSHAQLSTRVTRSNSA